MIDLVMGRVFCVRNEPMPTKQMSSLTSLLLYDRYKERNVQLFTRSEKELGYF
jgi:hypothetical protein